MAEKSKSFEERLGELDEIVKKLEGGDITLAEMLTLFESGVKIARECSSELENAEKKINVLVEDGNGKMEPQPFDNGVEG